MHSLTQNKIFFSGRHSLIKSNMQNKHPQHLEKKTTLAIMPQTKHLTQGWISKNQNSSTVTNLPNQSPTPKALLSPHTTQSKAQQETIK